MADLLILEAPTRFELVMEILQTSALPLGYAASPGHDGSGAENGVRTRDPRLGKPMLYQLSYFRSLNLALV